MFTLGWPLWLLDTWQSEYFTDSQLYKGLTNVSRYS